MMDFSEFITHYGIRFDRVLGALLILLVSIALIFFVDRFIRRVLLRGRVRINVSYETILLVARGINIALWIGVVMLVLSYWGISMSGIWTLLMSVAAVIGVGFLAVWTMVSNITANLFLTIWRPFFMGSTVELIPENIRGRVVDRNMMFTVLRETQSGEVFYIPNNLFFQKMFRVGGTHQKHLFEYYEQTPPDGSILADMFAPSPPAKGDDHA